MASPPPPREGREFDMVIFGASGFTGQYILEMMAKTAIVEEIKWAVAGRTKIKLEASLASATKHTGIDVTNTTVIIADVADAESIIAMCRRTKLLLNCVGPYLFYGEIVLTTCVENQTDQLDLSGEPYYSESMQLKYNAAAEKSGVYVIGSAGVSTIATECALQFLKANFDGDVNSVDIVLYTDHPQKKDSVHYGTYESWIYTAKVARQRNDQKEILFKKRLPKSNYPVKGKFMTFNKHVGKWCGDFSSFDITTQNTEYYNYHHRNMRPAQTNMYLAANDFSEVLSAAIMLVYIGWFIALFSYGRKILREFHGLLSGGVISKRGPSREMLGKTKFRMTAIGTGHSKKLRNPEEQHTTSPDKTLVITIDGPDPAYITTSMCMVQTALCVLKEREKLPNKGGVLPSGAALLDTSIIKRLSNSGLAFKVRSDDV